MTNRLPIIAFRDDNVREPVKFDKNISIHLIRQIILSYIRTYIENRESFLSII